MTSKPFGVNLTILPALIPADYDGYAKVWQLCASITSNNKPAQPQQCTMKHAA
jgi:hypothetical protein